MQTSTRAHKLRSKLALQPVKTLINQFLKNLDKKKDALGVFKLECGGE